MRISRLEASVAEDTSPSDWPELANVNLRDWPEVARRYAKSEPVGGWTIWRADVARREQVCIEMVARGEPTDVPPTYCYMVQLPGEEFGALLGALPLDAVPEVIDAFLRTARPELLGAVAGRIIGGLITHIATAASSRRDATDA